MNAAAARAAAALVLLALGACPKAERAFEAAATTAALPLAALLSALRRTTPAGAIPVPEEGILEAFLHDEAVGLLPADPTLRARTFLHAGVLAREERGGLLLLSAGSEDGAVAGAPAVLGDALAGFVESVGARTCRVRTVLSSRFRAAGRTEKAGEEGEGSPAMVLAGTGRPFLAIAVAERMEQVRAGDAVRCASPPFPPGEEGFPGPLGEGFSLGVVEESSRGSPTRVRPAAELSRSSSLLLVVGMEERVVVPRAREAGTALLAPVFGFAEVSPGRRSVLVRVGSREGLREGDPATLGPRLLGTLAAVGPWSARVRLLGDPAFGIAVSLRREGEPAVPLGEARPEGGGGTRFRVRPDAGDLRGTLHFSGERLPRGLLLGSGEVGGGILRLDPALDPTRLPSLEILPAGGAP